VISDQEERVVSVEQFVHGKKDVLVATDIASKGLDFPNIQHVVNYDMPDDIENYGRLLLTVCIHFSTTDTTITICGHYIGHAALTGNSPASYELEDFVGAKFYSPHALADGN